MQKQLMFRAEKYLLEVRVVDNKRFKIVFYEKSFANGVYKIFEDMQTGVEKICGRLQIAPTTIAPE